MKTYNQETFYDFNDYLRKVENIPLKLMSKSMLKFLHGKARYCAHYLSTRVSFNVMHHDDAEYLTRLLFNPATSLSRDPRSWNLHLRINKHACKNMPDKFDGMWTTKI